MYQDPAKLERVAKVMRTISHPVRLCIVELLLNQGRLNVKDIYEEMNISQSNASQHLKLMEAAGILKGERKGAMVFYELANEGMAKMLVSACQCA
ncbi:MAG: metalloregulator ArsR/SmtB family transcription factor [Bacteroidota bacterium]